jgi:hypothetical protein
MKQMIQNSIQSILPYLSVDIVVPALISLLGLYMFILALFSLG